MTDIIRDPEFYSPTIHASQQRRDRDIDWASVADAIQNGSFNWSKADPEEGVFRGEKARNGGYCDGR